MHVTAQVVNHSMAGKPQGTFTRFLTKVAGEGQDIDLETGSGIVQLLITLAPAGIIGVTLGVSQNGLVALDLHVKQQIVKIHQFLLEGILQQNVITGEWHQVIGGIFLVKVLIHAVLGTEVQIDFHTSVGDSILELEKCVHEALTSVFERHSGHM